MQCPIDISHGGVSLTPFSLFTLLTSITNHTHTHPLLFRQDDHEFSIEFRPSMAVFTPDEAANRTEQPSSFCHFQGANADGLRAWLSGRVRNTACNPTTIEMILRAPFASYTLRQANETFSLVSRGADSCDKLRAHLAKRGVIPHDFEADHQLPEYYKRYQHLFERKRYVELAMFGDYSLLKRYDDDEVVTKNRMLRALHMANSYYDSLNIELRLVHLSVLKSSTVIKFTNQDTVLDSFEAYLKKQQNLPRYDTANLMTGVHRDDSHFEKTIGLAWNEKICSHEDLHMSTSWVEDYDLEDVAQTLAHEIGHVLGMNHDNEGNHQNCECPDDECIMFPSTVIGHVQYWSSCSLSDLEAMYRTNSDYCLWDEPAATIEKAKCGNGVVERGEECDCGQLGCVTHDCCDPRTCKLRAGAQCAFGSCCDVTTCSVLKKAQKCRDAKNTCDLPEHCDGLSTECPVDKHRPDGDRCPEDDESICYGGRCGSRAVQCRELWGDDARPAPKSCYKGNDCMTDPNAGLRKCAKKDATCGVLMCSMPERKRDHLRGWHYTYSSESKCRAMWIDYQNSFNPDYYMGMVPDGSSCGDGKMCLKSKCVASDLVPTKAQPPAASSLAGPTTTLAISIALAIFAGLL